MVVELPHVLLLLETWNWAGAFTVITPGEPVSPNPDNMKVCDAEFVPTPWLANVNEEGVTYKTGEGVTRLTSKLSNWQCVPF